LTAAHGRLHAAQGILCQNNAENTRFPFLHSLHVSYAESKAGLEAEETKWDAEQSTAARKQPDFSAARSRRRSNPLSLLHTETAKRLRLV
jgi:hypothetical protein